MTDKEHKCQFIEKFMTIAEFTGEVRVGIRDVRSDVNALFIEMRELKNQVKRIENNVAGMNVKFAFIGAGAMWALSLLSKWIGTIIK